MKKETASAIIGLVITSFLLFSPFVTHAQQDSEPDPNSFTHTLADYASRIVTLNNPVELVDTPEGFTIAEDPSFTLEIPQKTSTNIGKKVEKVWKNEDESIEVSVKSDHTGEEIPAIIEKNDAGVFTISPQQTEDWRPGSYTLEVSAQESFLFTRDLTQNFSWGVLAFNTHKDRYRPGEKADLSFGILDSQGSTLCDAGLSLKITSPKGTVTVLDRSNGGIKQSGHCQGDTNAPVPDYLGTFTFAEAGVYQFELTGNNNNGTHTIKDVIEASDTIPFEIDRTSFPTRVFPLEPYTVTLKVTAHENYKGKVQDFVPRSFYIENISDEGTTDQRDLTPMEMTEEEKQRITEAYKDITNKTKLFFDETSYVPSKVDKTPVPITWNVDWKAGGTYTLSYTIHFPTISPEFFVVGPLAIGDYKENRQWQIANDLTCTWQAGSPGNWGTSGNWSCGRVPNSSDTAVFNSTSVQNATINVAVNTRSISINTGYTGTITQSGTNTITLSGNNTGFVQQAGTFVGGSGNIVLSTDAASFNQTGGTHTATSGIMRIADGFISTGGTFNNNGGTIDFTVGDGAKNINTNGKILNNLTFVSSCQGTYTITSSTTTYVDGTLTLTNSCGWGIPTLAGTGTLMARGNIVASGTGIDGSGAVTVGGTGTQTFTGENDTDTRIPAIIINKTGGSVTFSETFVSNRNFTYTAGTVAHTSSSTFRFTGTMTFAGNMTFRRIHMGAGSGNSERYLTNGTTLTVTENLYLDPGTSQSFTSIQPSSGTASINLSGDLYTINEGMYGSVIINLVGTGDQNVYGESSDVTTSTPGITINKPSGTLTFNDNISVEGNFTYTQGNYVTTGSTIGFDGNITITGSFTFDTMRLHTRGGNSTRTIASGTTLTVNGDLYVGSNTSDGFTDMGGGGEVHARGDIYFYGQGMRDTSTSKIVVNGTGDQVLDSEADTNTQIPHVEINKSSGTTTLTDTFYIVTLFDVISGTVDGSAADFYHSRGNISGTFNISSYYLCPTAWNTVEISSGTLTVEGNATINDTGCQGSDSFENVNGPGILNAKGNVTFGGTKGIQGNLNIVMSGTGTQTFTYSDTRTRNWSGDLTINKTSGTVIFPGNTSLNQSGQDLTVQSGTLQLGSYNLTVTGGFSVQSAGEVSLTGDQTITTGSTTFAGGATYTGTGTYTTLALGNTYNNLTITGTGSTFSPTGTFTVNGDFTLSAGTFNAPTNITFGGDIDVSGGTFNPGNNTVVINNADNTTAITGSITFYNLTVSTGNKVIVLDDSSSYEVSNALVMRASAQAPIYLRSDNPGIQASFDVTYGSPQLIGVIGEDIDSCGGEIIQVSQGGSNGNVSCWTFSIEGYYDNAWTERKRLKIESSLVVDGPHSNFPVLLQLNDDAELIADAQGDGDDILFTADDGITLLDFEIQSYSSGDLVAWVEIPEISSSEDTFFYMYYGNSSTSSLEDPAGTWDNNFHAVWHMEESPSAGNDEIQDSTANNRDGSAGSYLNGSDLVTGVFGSGLDFDGSGGNNQMVRVANGAGLNNTSTGTISLWVQWRGTQSSVYPGNKYGAIMAREQNGVFGNNIIALNSSNPASSPVTWTFQNANDKTITGTTPVGNNTWRYVTVTFTSGNHRLYVDGQLEGTSSTTGSLNNNSAIDFTFGGWEGQGKPNVIMDELRLSSVARSAGWVETEYSNMTNPSTFITIEGDSSGTPGVRINGGTRIQGGTVIN